MRCLIPSVVIIATLCAEARAGDTETSCVPEGEIKPVEIPEDVRALVQEHKCHVLLSLAPDPNIWKDCPGIQQRVENTLEFCKDPLAAKIAVSGDDIEAVRSIVEGKARCGASRAAVTTQTAESVALPSQDVLLQGLANFVIARAKAEAMAFLVDHLADQVCGNVDGSHLLPASCELLAGKPEGNAWGTLKVAFEKDMERLPERALACAANRAGASKGVHTLVYFGAQIGRLIYQGKDPVSLLAGLQRDGYTAEQCKADHVNCALHIFGFTMQLVSPRGPATDPQYNPENMQRFVKLLARRLLDELTRLQVVTPKQLEQIKADATALEALQVRLDKMQQQSKSLADKLATLKVDLEKSTTLEARLAILAKLARTAVGFLDVARIQTIGWLRDEIVKDENSRAQLDQLDKNTISALTAVTDILDVYDKIANQKYAHVYVEIALAVQALKLTKIGNDLDEVIRKFMPFICEIAAAKTPEDVQRSLEAAAAPVGGGLAKRGAHRRTVALTAFAGVAAGGEFAYPTSGTSDLGGQAGLFVPVGVDVSWGLGVHHSLGLYLSVIDLGTLASFRTEQHTTIGGMTDKFETAPQIGFQQVVSPGIYFVWGIDRFSFGVGASMNPELRKVTSDGKLVEDANAFRFGVFAAVDVTILPF